MLTTIAIILVLVWLLLSNLEKFQFIRHGFFNLEHKNNQIRNFNEIVALKKNIKH
ncbi:MAG: hypothetical protein Q8890_02340 [Sweet potato little leaf phytoplasma]|nr:hypothetical protein [Sweet potato little leaf phytoplasma]